MHAQRPRLLVVDDDRAILTLVGTIALAEGFDVATTVDGADALQQLAARRRIWCCSICGCRASPGSRCCARFAMSATVPRRADVGLRHDRQRGRSGQARRDGLPHQAVRPAAAAPVCSRPCATRPSERRAVLMLEGELAQRLEFCGMIGRGPAMQEVFDLIRRLAPHARTALVTGETGTGKELAARALHKLGPRGDQALRHGELLGGRRDAVRERAVRPRARRLHRRDRDTRPACSKPPTAARCSSTRSASCRSACRPSCCACSRTGKCSASARSSTRKVDVRLIAATNRDLRAEVAAGRSAAISTTG